MDSEALFERAWNALDSNMDRNDAKFWFTAGLLLKEDKVEFPKSLKTGKRRLNIGRKLAIRKIITEFNAWRMKYYPRAKTILLEDLDAFLLKILNNT